VGQTARARVGQQRADEDVVGVLLQRLSHPAGRPSDDEQGDGQVVRQPQEAVGETGVEVDVGGDAVPLPGPHRSGDRVQDVEAGAVAAFLAQLDDAGTQVAHARVLGAVDAVAEAHDGLAPAPEGGDV